MERWLACFGVLAAACGRYEFNRTAIDAAAPDVTLDAAPPAPVHRYRLASSYVDDAGGPQVKPLGGTLGADGYRLAINQGLELDGLVPLSTYTIQISFAFDQIGGYRKILDFKNLTMDEGLYVLGETLDFVVDAAKPLEVTSRALFSAGTLAELTLTRGADDLVTAYVNRAVAISFPDPTHAAEPTFQGRVVFAGVDDAKTTPNEAGAGVIRAIAIWDVALTPAELAAQP